MSAADLALASAVVCFGSVLQGSVGFGLALVAAPILALIDPRLVPGPLLCGSLALTVLVAHRDRDAIDPSGITWGLVGRLPGTALGALALGAISAEAAGIVLGALVLLAVAITASRVRLEPTPGTLVGAGALSGFMGTITSIGGPPIAIVYQHATGPHLRGTLAGYFVIGAVMSLIALVLVGRFGWQDFWWSLALIPGAAVGFALSGHLVAVIDRGYTRTAVLTVSAGAGAAVIVRQFF